jgi:nitrogen fixation NifU-like protein
LTPDEWERLTNAGYSATAIELYGNQVNVGILENADVALAYTGPCGDSIKLYLKIRDETIIEDARFQYLGCPASVACGSVVTQMIIGMTIQEATRLAEDDVLQALGSVPAHECHCAELALTTLQKTIAKYAGHRCPP